jgi:hypothetical protein
MDQFDDEYMQTPGLIGKDFKKFYGREIRRLAGLSTWSQFINHGRDIPVSKEEILSYLDKLMTGISWRVTARTDKVLIIKSKYYDQIYRFEFDGTEQNGGK